MRCFPVQFMMANNQKELSIRLMHSANRACRTLDMCCDVYRLTVSYWNERDCQQRTCSIPIDRGIEGLAPSEDFWPETLSNKVHEDPIFSLNKVWSWCVPMNALCLRWIKSNARPLYKVRVSEQARGIAKLSGLGSDARCGNRLVAFQISKLLICVACAI